jgi:replication factor C large subunit
MNRPSSEIIYLIYGQSVGMDWAEKYRPRRLEDLVGNSAAIRQMVEWAQSWNKDKKPLILYGKPGTGKTSSAHALANEMGWEIIELNASDQRTKGVIEKVAGSSSMTASLSGATQKLILLDEADNLQGTADRGGARAIIEVIKFACQPIILVANELYELSPELRSRCDTVQFRALPARSIVPRLRYICSAEGIEYDENALKEIAESAAGDIRAAINMLYASALGRDQLTEDEVYTSKKDQRSSIFDLVSAVFGSPGGEELMRISYEVDETPDTMEQWLEANLHHLKDREKIAKSYSYLSRSDEYIGYTFRHQYYTLWRYAAALMILGTSAASAGKGIHARIMPPSRWRKMGTYKKQKSLRLELSRKLSSLLHIPREEFRDTYMSPLSMLVDHDPYLYSREFSLDVDELNLFLQDRSRSQEVVKKIQAMERIADKEKAKEEKELRKKKEKMQQEKLEEAVSRSAGVLEREENEEGAVTEKSQKTLFDGF